MPLVVDVIARDAVALFGEVVVQPKVVTKFMSHRL